MVHGGNKKVHREFGEEGTIAEAEEQGFVEALIFHQESTCPDKKKMIMIVLLR